jgi:hypothetical protein
MRRFFFLIPAKSRSGDGKLQERKTGGFGGLRGAMVGADKVAAGGTVVAPDQGGCELQAVRRSQ